MLGEFMGQKQFSVNAGGAGGENLSAIRAGEQLRQVVRVQLVAS